MKRPGALAVARALARWRLARVFDGIWVDGLDAARQLSRQQPVLFCATHVGWWDGLVLLPVDEALGTDGHVLMDAGQLAKLGFFRWLGALGLDRRSPAAMRRGMREAASVLDRPGRSLWMFPQGRHRPAHLRPLGLQRGVELLAKMTGAAIVPVALTYAFREAPQPSALLSFGAPVADEGLEAALVAGLERADRFVDTGEPSFSALVEPRGGRVDATPFSRALSWFSRPRLTHV